MPLSAGMTWWREPLMLCLRRRRVSRHNAEVSPSLLGVNHSARPYGHLLTLSSIDLRRQFTYPPRIPSSCALSLRQNIFNTAVLRSGLCSYPCDTPWQVSGRSSSYVAVACGCRVDPSRNSHKVPECVHGDNRNTSSFLLNFNLETPLLTIFPTIPSKM